jgi:hypothetical protein
MLLAKAFAIVAAFPVLPVFPSSVNPLAARSSSACEAYMKQEEARYTTVWRPTIGSKTDHEDHGNRNQLWLSEKFQLAFVENQKAGTRTLIHTLRRLFPSDWKYVTTKYFGGHGDESMSQLLNNRSMTIFTFVREPFSAFKSAYEEISHRDPPQRNRNAKHNTYSLVPCEQGSKRIAYFVDDLLRAQSIGRDAFHAWPQTVKTSNVPRLDFIGRVETMEADLRDLVALVYAKLGREMGEHVQVQAPRLNPRTQKLREGKAHMVGKECSQYTLNANITADTTRRICDEVLAADYVCFGYDAVNCGRKSEFVPPPPVHFGELRKWENQHTWVKGVS